MVLQLTITSPVPIVTPTPDTPKPPSKQGRCLPLRTLSRPSQPSTALPLLSSHCRLSFVLVRLCGQPVLLPPPFVRYYHEQLGARPSPALLVSPRSPCGKCGLSSNRMTRITSDCGSMIYHTFMQVQTIIQHNGLNHLGLWFNGLPSNRMARITSDCGVKVPLPLVFWSSGSAGAHAAAAVGHPRTTWP